MRWHTKPPVNGRELTAEDVRYTYDRFLTSRATPTAMLEMVDKVEALDKYTVKFTLKEPYAWFLDALASTSTWIIAKECVDQFGDLKRPESVVGTGPWMLESYEPNVRMTFTATRTTSSPACPTPTGSRSPSPRTPRPPSPVPVRQVRLRPGVRHGDPPQRPGHRAPARKGLAAGLHVVFGGFIAMKLDQEPFKDVRVRRAFACAPGLAEVLETNAWSQGKGAPNPLVPAALKEWSIPIDQLPPEGRKLYEFDPAEAKRLLAEAGLPTASRPLETTPGYGPTDGLDADRR